MPLAIPTTAELQRQMAATIASLDTTLATSDDSDIGILITMLREALFGLHYQIGRSEERFFVGATTPTDALVQHARARLGAAHRAPGIASGTDALQLTGTDGSEVAIGVTLSYRDGTQYRLTTAATIASGVATASVESITKGKLANRAVGETLTFDSPPAGINATATVVVAITGGIDGETNGELAARVLDSYRNPPAGGRFGDFRQWATAVVGVHRAYAYGPSDQALTGRRGLGIVDVAITVKGTGAERIPSQDLADLVADAIDTKRPHGAQDFSVLVPEASAEAVEADITPQPGYEFDWTKIAAVTVSSWAAATLTITTSADVSVYASTGSRALKAGDHILMTRSGVAGACLATVKSVSTTSVVLTEAPTLHGSDAAFTPTNGDNFEPAGPLTAPLLDAVMSLFDDLSPARGSAANPEQETDDVLRLATLIATLKRGRIAADLTDYSVAGVKDVEVTTPAASVTPTDDVPDGVPELIVYDALNLHPPLGT